MRIIDPTEIPARNYGNGRPPKYPYDEIRSVIADGKGVEIDPADYGVSADTLLGAVHRYRSSHNLPWRISKRGDLLYIVGKAS